MESRETASKEKETAMMTDRQALAQRGQRLEHFTILWNSLEGLIAVSAGALAGSISLVGFGVDSFIEVTSGSAVLWRMSMDADLHQRERIEGRTLRIVGACFLALAAYVAVEAIRNLVGKEAAAPSWAGILLACVSLVVMPVLSRAKRRVGTAMQSRAMQADATQTEFCTYLSAILLGGLLLNMLFGWWWADPVAALVMVPIIVKEGAAGLRGDRCCD
jgi:divalent metal cation (Fe/Co/Zn/Cd) transporter